MTLGPRARTPDRYGNAAAPARAVPVILRAMLSLSRRRPLVLALFVGAAALGATWGAWRIAHQQFERHWQAQFDVEAREGVRRLEERMATYEQVERATQAFLLGSMQVARADFRLFVDSVKLTQRFPGIQGIALSELVQPAQLPAHLARIRADGMPDYAIRPAGLRTLYSSITHIEPFTGLNLRAAGFDMLTDPTRRRAMERARDSGQATASGKVRLIQEDGRNVQSGFVMYIPVYRRGAATDTVAARRAAIVGWVGAPFRMDDLMAGLAGERAGDITLSIYDGDAVQEGARLYDARAAARATAFVPGREPAGFRPLYSTVQHIVVAGQPWALDIRSSAQFERRIDRSKPNLIALIGSAGSLLIGLLVWILATGRRRAIAIAGHMTKQLSISEFRWKYALEGAGDGVWDWDRGTGSVIFSTRWKQMLGYDDADIEGTFSQFDRLLHPDDAAGVMATLDAYLAGTSGNYQAEFRMLCKDGSWRWILARGMAVTRDAAGAPVRTIGTHTDISRSREDADNLRTANARLAAEQRRVQVILDHSHDAFVAVAHDGRITDWNAKAQAMFGWSAAEAVGQPLDTLIVPDAARGAHNAAFESFLRSGDAVSAGNVVEVNVLQRSGRLLPVELAIAGFPQESGHAASAFIRDISERKLGQQLERDRSRALEEARTALSHAQKLESVGKLTGGIAHDFNNVLHIIGGNVQLLKLGKDLDERVKKRLDSIQGAVDRGAKLSSQLQVFARRQPLQPVAVNAQRALRDMDDLLKRAVGEAVAISIASEPGLWNTLADPGQLENVILNLAINARDAMPGGGALHIDLRNVTWNAGDTPAWVDAIAGDYVRLSISDNGVGMAPEVVALAFEPFFTTKPVGAGTGLGLSMAYGFVKQSNGHIHIDSAPGEGTTVVIHLPRSDAPVENAVAPAPLNAVGGNETVLVVEDDPEVKATAVGILRQLGY
jgi:PAS domain S-box-containing protein